MNVAPEPSVFAQTRALALLVLRFWKRGPLRTARQASGGRRTSAFVLRVVFLLIYGNLGRTYGAACAHLRGPEQLVGVEWLVLGLFGYAAALGFTSSGSWVRGVVHPLVSPFLDMLPLMETSRVLVLILQNLVAHVLAIAAISAAAPSLGLWPSVGLGAAISTTGILVGVACGRAVRTFVSSMRVARATMFVVGFQMVFFFVIVAASQLASWSSGAFLVGVFHPVASAALHGSVIRALPVMVLATLAASAAIRWANRIGYDRSDAVPSERIVSAGSHELTLDRIERLLMTREPGRRFIILAVVYTTLGAGGLAFAAFTSHIWKDPVWTNIVLSALGFTSFLSFTQGFQRATRFAERDLLARAFLAPLPIPPSALLAGKMRPIRARMLVIAAPMIVLVVLPGSAAQHFEMLWRVVTLGSALALTAGAIVSIAFLTTGLGGVSRGGGGGTFSLEAMLLFLPLIRVATAPYLWSAVVSLTCVAFLAIEARRAALRCVRWQDDGEGFERETPIWRALLVFTTFQAGQALVLQFLGVSGVPEMARLAIAYAIAAAGLLALTAHERRGLPPIAIRPAKWWFLAIGAAGGLASGSFGLAYVRALKGLGVDVGEAIDPNGAILFAIVAVTIAPIAEEVFFRGWLQDAIGQQYAKRGRVFAIVLTAFAFAAVHPALSFVPVLVLGLVAGWLFGASRGALAGIVAHAVHNTIAVVAR